MGQVEESFHCHRQRTELVKMLLFNFRMIQNSNMLIRLYCLLTSVALEWDLIHYPADCNGYTTQDWNNTAVNKAQGPEYCLTEMQKCMLQTLT